MATEKQKIARKENLLRLIISASIKKQMHDQLTNREKYLWQIIQAASSALLAKNDGKDEIWITGNNSLLSIKDMDNDHLHNSINFISADRMIGKELHYVLFWKFMLIGEAIRRGYIEKYKTK